LDDVPGTLPVVVLGDQAARWLGVTRLPDRGPLPQVVVGDGLFTVVGILDPVPLAPAVDQSVLVGWDAARTSLGFDGHPTVVYLTSDERALEDVRAVLPATLSPDVPGLVQVSRPSDVLLAKRQTESTFSGLFVGLAGVSLLVGGIGIANTMVISVLERRREIGLRRALGAPGGTSARSSSWRPPCSRGPGARSAQCSGAWGPRPTRSTRAGRSSSSLRRSCSASPDRSGSGAPPDSTPRCARPGCRPPRRWPSGDAAPGGDRWPGGVRTLVRRTVPGRRATSPWPGSRRGEGREQDGAALR